MTEQVYPEACPECGRIRLWGGLKAGWLPHTEGHHQALRRGLLRAAGRLLAQETDLRLWRAQNAAQGFVGIRWRNGVYPGWQAEQRSQVPRKAWETWSEGFRDQFLWDSREMFTWWLRSRHGLTVNQATWFHKIYDDVER